MGLGAFSPGARGTCAMKEPSKEHNPCRTWGGGHKMIPGIAAAGNPEVKIDVTFREQVSK